LLLSDGMQPEASHVVRTIRRALGMSQAEFARALGWCASTISRWESGKAEPDRLALKIILAYGEERGVRYRPRAKALPVPVATDHLPAVPAVVIPGSRQAPGDWATSVAGERPGWQAQLSFRVAVDGARDPNRQLRFSRRVAGGALCTALVLGIALMTATPSRIGRDRTDRPAARVSAAETPAEALAAAPAARRTQAESRRARRRARAVPEATASTAVSAVAPEPPAPPPLQARLEGVTLLGDVRTATFRTDDNAISLAEGETIGTQRAERVRGDGVDLRDAAGELHTVKLGDTVAVE
jgi:DNA-binding XRE family transcriptional regulator